MIHKFSMNGYNIVLDVDGGSVHILDYVAYELVDLYEENTKEEIINITIFQTTPPKNIVK